MKAHFEFHPNSLLVLPHLSLQSIDCEDCGEDNGAAIVVGWLLFTVIFHFFGNAHHDEA